MLPRDGQELARVWEEARKALAIQGWTEDEEIYLFRLVEWEVEMDRRGRKVESETRRESQTTLSTPIRSFPVEELMEGGFIRPLEDGGHIYLGPDASVLMSDLFVNEHCFRLVEREDHPEVIGLAFEPVRDDGVPDIEGTLWVDRETAHLRVLEFVYTNEPTRDAQGVSQGQLIFERLPTGAWIIQRFWIQGPILQPYFHGDFRMVGIKETGGEVEGIIALEEAHPLPVTFPLTRPPAGSSPDSALTTFVREACREEDSPPSSSALLGTVWGIPLEQAIPGAMVTVRWRPDDALDRAGLVASSVERHAFTDLEGRYRFCGVPTGRTIILRVFYPGWEHPAEVLQLEAGPYTILNPGMEPDQGDGGGGSKGGGNR
jgi:hypothetical protein